MKEQLQNTDDFLPEDKVCIRSGHYTRAREVIQAESNGVLKIQQDESSIVHMLQMKSSTAALLGTTCLEGYA